MKQHNKQIQPIATERVEEQACRMDKIIRRELCTGQKFYG